MNAYHLVDEKSESFGYKRMQYNLGYNSSLKGFVDSHGQPSFIYEYKNESNRDSIRLYYAEKNEVYVYESNSWLADSLFLRSMTTSERKIYDELKYKFNGTVVANGPEIQTHIDIAHNHLENESPNKAVEELDMAIDKCYIEFKKEQKRVYTSRSSAETLFYMVKAAVDRVEAIAVDTTCSDVLYLRGYASIELEQLDIGEIYLKRAVVYAPMNSMYLSELGHLYQTKGEWANALEMFTKAEEAAQTFSPPDLSEQELTRAKRGIGYNLIELGRLDEAEEKFKECLKINSNNKGSSQELEYIKQLRKTTRSSA